MHIPVLLEEALAGMQIRPGGVYLDATLGAGEHAVGMLRASAPDGKLLGLDADPEAISYAHQVLQPYGDRAVLRVGNFRNVKSIATASGFRSVDGVLMDLGLSSRQLADPARGFSFSQDGPLDMRLDPNEKMCAADLVNSLSETRLADLLWRYGEERHARRIARAVIQARPLRSTTELADLIVETVGRRERIHPATRTFQALRIAVNNEIESLTEALPQARDLLRAEGRLAVISFHSLEDRLVKRFFQREARDCICPPETPLCVCQHKATLRIITRKPIRPTEKEVARNPRSRSAKLRVAVRT